MNFSHCSSGMQTVQVLTLLPGDFGIVPVLPDSLSRNTLSTLPTESSTWAAWMVSPSDIEKVALHPVRHMRDEHAPGRYGTVVDQHENAMDFHGGLLGGAHSKPLLAAVDGSGFKPRREISWAICAWA